METVSAGRGHVCRPLLGNQELPAVPPQTWTHHLGAADSVEPAGDSASATCPHVVLKLTGLTSDTGPPLSAPATSAPTGSVSSKDPRTRPTGLCTLGPDKTQQPAPKAAVHPRAHTQTRARVCLRRVGRLESPGRARPVRGPLRPREQPCPPPPSQAGLRPWGLGADSLGSKPSQE